MALADIHGLSQVEHGEEAAPVVVGGPAAVVFLEDGAVWEALVLCGFGDGARMRTLFPGRRFWGCFLGWLRLIA